MVTAPDLQGHGGERQPYVRGLNAPGVASWPGRGGGQRGLNTPGRPLLLCGCQSSLRSDENGPKLQEVHSLSVARTYSSGVPAAKGRTGQGQKPTPSGEAKPSSAREEESGGGTALSGPECSSLGPSDLLLLLGRSSLLCRALHFRC